ncbi:MAG: electron transport complex subunit RsxB [Thiomonas sp.]|nr:electron transport complex subunit RsxB [Thiomonas sp.]
MPNPSGALAAQIDALLPQTQCTRCGYPDCTAYAQAIAEGQAEINRCPPGGAQGIARLSELLQRPALALNPECGAEAPRLLAVIDPAQCIGCTLCIQACPVDAIAGAPKRMHTVIAQWCTGCALCLPPCPVDCIRMEPLPDAALAAQTGWDAWTAAQSAEARQRYARHLERHPRQLAQAVAAEQAQTKPPAAPAPAADRKAALLQAALERARQRQAAT